MRLEKTDFERAARKMVRIARCIKKMIKIVFWQLRRINLAHEGFMS